MSHEYVRVMGAHFNVDEVIIEQFAEALIKQDKQMMDRVNKHVKDRLSGLCFCSAHSRSECICGSW